MHRGKGMKFVGDSRISTDRKPNIPKDYSEYPGKTEAFWPNFLLKEWIVGAVFLVGFLCLTAAHPSPLERIADPTDTAYVPLPDWYFLFLYQLLKYTYASGPYNIVGAMIVPGLAFGALFLAPFLDRGPERKPTKRPLAVGFMLLAIAAVFYLTWESAAHHDWEASKKQGAIVEGADIDKDSEGYKYFEANTCISCHGAELTGGPAAPSLVDTGLTPEEVAEIAVKGKGTMPAGVFKGTDEELKVLAEFVSNVKTE
ncbi:c-type cytochrome [Peribacillus psychrosaccharolyticus]|uniref:Menaquinol:cytochrome c reductase cytochrome c subunit n=1 Tax=Peribacillus psychrosaccharolyticus TaxID=1407 RepID=A0A974NLZ5_PERPY|nr:menaquinol-cytochrome c reductase cytochrome b/c subunit [Peribacillus psychrosaccharolyticus]MEC2056709.1 c-type cytochrome [Peribacillus psychrosaccharolyticus]MED3746163.1 c-type cytochrome [Peribacillus psychrosaccharolyticus]QQT00164.1 c-type cytochrome [Peribacillus psychrosaccharolyticus]